MAKNHLTTSERQQLSYESKCVICQKKAITNYPGLNQEDSPSCGSIRCELIMQEGMDFHAECGDR